MLNKIFPINSKRRNFVRKIYYKYFSKYSYEERLYKRWINENEPKKEELLKQMKKEFTINPKISIVVPVYNTPKKYFKELVKSLQNQTYSNWELCLADGSPKSLDFIQGYLQKDNRIKYKEIGENKGISENTNEALSIATGDYIGLLDHDDLLPKFSLYEIVKTINENPEVEFIYSDEDKLENKNGPRYGVFFKPDFSPYTLNSANYICHFSIFKRTLMNKLNGFRSEYDGSQDYDIVARAAELTNNIVHIPKVLYHWRAHKNSTAQNSDSKPYAFEVGKKVIKDHIKRQLDTDVEVTDGLTPGSYEVKYIVKDNPKVSIIVDGKNSSNIQKIIEEIEKSTYENYEIILIYDKKINSKKSVKIVNMTENRINDYNEAVKIAEGKYFMIIDKNLERIDKESYIEDLVGICQDKNVGLVGTKLYNKKNNVEHCGIIIGINGTGDFVYKGVPKDAGTYMQRLQIIHNVSCVYMKYAMIDKEVFMQIDKFSSEFTGINTSIDMCLKILKLGKQVVINPIISFCVETLSDIEKSDLEEKKIELKWKDNYQKGDIYYSPNLSKKSTGIEINV